MNRIRQAVALISGPFLAAVFFSVLFLTVTISVYESGLFAAETQIPTLSVWLSAIDVQVLLGVCTILLIAGAFPFLLLVARPTANSAVGAGTVWGLVLLGLMINFVNGHLHVVQSVFSTANDQLGAIDNAEIPPADSRNALEFSRQYYESDEEVTLHAIDEPGLPSVLVTRDGNSIGIGIFQQSTGTPVVTLKDESADGVFDYISYSALSADGESLATVEDFRMDGTPDFKLYVRDLKPAAKVNVNDEWIEVYGVGVGSPPSPTDEIRGREMSLQEVLDSLGRQ